MKKIVLSLLIIPSFFACERNAITGRSQLSLVPESQVQTMALAEYSSFLSTNKVLIAASNKNAAMVKNVGAKLINAITNYYVQNNLSQVLIGYNWEVNLVEDKNINAWCD